MNEYYDSKGNRYYVDEEIDLPCGFFSVYRKDCEGAMEHLPRKSRYGTREYAQGELDKYAQEKNLVRADDFEKFMKDKRNLPLFIKIYKRTVKQKIS